MTPETYEQALRDRGFTHNVGCGLWVGPFNIRVTDALSIRQQTRGPERNVGNQFARASSIGQIDEQLRAARGLPRVPLVEPTDRFTSTLSPYVHIPDPGTSPPSPVYPPHQKNLPPGGRRLE